jgi:S1-C subfamily serine protease
VIHAVNGTHVTDLDMLRSALSTVKPTDSLVLQVEREGRMMFLVLETD